MFSLSDFSEFEHTSSAKSASLVRWRRPHRPHLEQFHFDAPPRTLPRRFRPSQPRADNANLRAHDAFSASFRSASSFSNTGLH